MSESPSAASNGVPRRYLCTQCRTRWAQGPGLLNGQCMTCARAGGFDGSTRDLEQARLARQQARQREAYAEATCVVLVPEPPVTRVIRGEAFEVVWPPAVREVRQPWRPESE